MLFKEIISLYFNFFFICNKHSSSTAKIRKRKKQSIGSNGRFHQHVYIAALLAQIPKAPKDSQVIGVFLHFFDLRAQKLLEKCWWNRPRLSLSEPAFNEIGFQWNADHIYWVRWKSKHFSVLEDLIPRCSSI